MKLIDAGDDEIRGGAAETSSVTKIVAVGGVDPTVPVRVIVPT